VVARTDVRLRALLSARFLPVVLGYAPSAREAASGVEERLNRYDPGRPSDDPPVVHP